MKSKTYKLGFVVFMIFFNDILFAQTQQTTTLADNYFKISGQYRIRPEYRRGYRVLASDTLKDALFIGQRARLIFDYKKNGISFYSSVQDSRTWGDEEQRKDNGGLQVNELWIEIPLIKKVSLKLGRQELAYDDHRILGNLDWANLTISHDALLVKYTNIEKGINWHLGGAYNQVGEPLFGTSYNLKNYKFLGVSWMKKDLSKIHSTLSLLAVVNGLTSTDTIHKAAKSSYTIGPLFNYQNKGLKAVVGAYYQGGKSENNLAINAYMINAYAQYRLKKYFGGLGGDLLSGNSDNTPATETNNFSTLYATNHKFYGYMDYFLSIPADTKQRGLMDLYLRVGFVPKKDIVLSLGIHSFSLTQANNTGAKKVGKDLGTEFDMLLDYQLSPIMHLQAGYSMMFGTTNMELIKGGDAGSYNGWAYIMFKVSPTLFVHEFTK